MRHGGGARVAGGAGANVLQRQGENSNNKTYYVSWCLYGNVTAVESEWLAELRPMFFSTKVRALGRGGIWGWPALARVPAAQT